MSYPTSSRVHAALSSDELLTLGRFHEVLLQVGAETPQRMPSLDDFIVTESWSKLSQAALLALTELGEDSESRRNRSRSA